MKDYGSNSHVSRNKQPEKKVGKIISGKAKIKKKNDVQKFADVFIAEDTHKVKNYIFMDVLLPAMKKAIYDVVTGGAKMFLYGTTNNRESTSSRSASWRNYYADDKSTRTPTSSYRNSYNIGNIVLEDRVEAEEVLIKMDEIISRYGLVRVADLYELVGITGNYTDNDYGWTSLNTARVDIVRDGYLLKLPRVMPLR